MKTLVVEMGGMRVSDDHEVTLATYALGSCIGLMLYDPVRKAAGMLHYMLPLASAASPDKAREQPTMFGETGIPLLFSSMYGLGCRKENIIVTVAGGSQVHDEDGVFNIGKRNYTVLRKMFWKNNVLIANEDVGGNISRTLYLDVATGHVTLRSGMEERLLWPLDGA